MENYTKEDVISELKKLYTGKKTRVRYLTDQRYYLIALLNYKFKVTEEVIFSYTKLTNRSSVHHAKRTGAELFRAEDPVFIRNVKDLIEKFPYDFPDIDFKISHKPHVNGIKFTVTPSTLEALKRYCDRKGFDTMGLGAKHIITNLLRLWEE
jgi:hypothetical protein